jgi:hypothetical protein
MTRALTPLTSPMAISTISTEGQRRLKAFQLEMVPVSMEDSEKKPEVLNSGKLVLEGCIEHTGQHIRSTPLSFLVFTPGLALIAFHYNLWRAWFAYWLGLPIPTPAEGAPRLENPCTCGRPYDSFGDHLICCGTKTNAKAVRMKGHNLVTRLLTLLAWRGGLQSTDIQGRIHHVRKRPVADSGQDQEVGEKRGDIQISYAAPQRAGQDRSRGNYWAFVGDITIASARVGAAADMNTWGSWEEGVLKNRDTNKCRNYNQCYGAEGVGFLPLVATTCSRLGNTMLRLIYFLAEKEAERACQNECYGECPLDIIKLLAHRGQAQVSCAVAVATAMRLTASSRDGPVLERWLSRPVRQIDHELDTPLFLAGTDGSSSAIFGQ